MDVKLYLLRSEPVMRGVIGAVVANRATFKRARPEKNKTKTTTCGDAEMKKESSRDCDRGGSQVDGGEIDQSPNDHY